MPPKKLCQGRAIWAVVSRKGINAKRRPGIIVTDAREIEAGKPIFVVVVSTDLTPSHDTKAEDIIPLPFHPQGRLEPGFRKPCAAICDWVEEVCRDAILEVHGILPFRYLARIAKRRADIQAAESKAEPAAKEPG